MCSKQPANQIRPQCGKYQTWNSPKRCTENACRPPILKVAKGNDMTRYRKEDVDG